MGMQTPSSLGTLRSPGWGQEQWETSLGPHTVHSHAAAAGLLHSPVSHRTSSECSSEGRSEDEETRSRLIDRIIQNDTEGYSTVEAPRAEGTSFSLPAHLYPDEVLDDLTISPYASFTSLSEPRPTMLSGWLDKLSPQGYVPPRGTRKAPSDKLGTLVSVLLGSQVSSHEEDPLGCSGYPWGKEQMGSPQVIVTFPTTPFPGVPTGTTSSRGAMSVLMGRT